MNYLNFQNALSPLHLFSIKDISKYFGGYDPRRLSEWQKKGYIFKVRNGFYLFSGEEISEEFLFFIANKVYNPSYISLESALSYYGIIPEGVYTITSVSSRKTYELSSYLTSFLFRSIKSELFFGYTLGSFKNSNFKIAYPEKAILDYLYLDNNIKDFEDIKALRWNIDVIKNLSINRFNLYLKIFSSKRLNEKFQILTPIF